MTNRTFGLVVVAAMGLSGCSHAIDPRTVESLEKQVAALEAQQARIEKDVLAIKSYLQGGQDSQQELKNVVGAEIPIAGEPTIGSASAKVTIVEALDYHCPFCRRNIAQTMPLVETDYIKTGKVRYVALDYPIGELHPNAAMSHEAAACAGDQGKFWPMHVALFDGSPVNTPEELAAKAKSIGADAEHFKECLGSRRHLPAIQASAKRMEQLGIPGTPITFIGITPAPGQPLRVVKFLFGAVPYPDVKVAIDEVLAQAK